MVYSISVQQSSPVGIVGVLSYYDDIYIVSLTQEKEKEPMFKLARSVNNTPAESLRLEMDSFGNIKEYEMVDGDKKNFTSPNVVSERSCSRISQSVFLDCIGDVLTTL